MSFICDNNSNKIHKENTQPCLKKTFKIICVYVLLQSNGNFWRLHRSCHFNWVACIKSHNQQYLFKGNFVMY